METVSISEFKATCLALLEKVRRTGQPIRVTRRGEAVAEVVPPSGAPLAERWLGSAASSGRITGDLVDPAIPVEDWEAST